MFQHFLKEQLYVFPVIVATNHFTVYEIPLHYVHRQRRVWYRDLDLSKGRPRFLQTKNSVRPRGFKFQEKLEMLPSFPSSSEFVFQNHSFKLNVFAFCQIYYPKEFQKLNLFISYAVTLNTHLVYSYQF